MKVFKKKFNQSRKFFLYVQTAAPGKNSKKKFPAASRFHSPVPVQLHHRILRHAEEPPRAVPRAEPELAGDRGVLRDRPETPDLVVAVTDNIRGHHEDVLRVLDADERDRLRIRDDEIEERVRAMLNHLHDAPPERDGDRVAEGLKGFGSAAHAARSRFFLTVLAGPGTDGW